MKILLSKARSHCGACGVNRVLHTDRMNSQRVRLLCTEEDTLEFEIDHPSSPYIVPIPVVSVAAA